MLVRKVIGFLKSSKDTILILRFCSSNPHRIVPGSKLAYLSRSMPYVFPLLGCRACFMKLSRGEDDPRFRQIQSFYGAATQWSLWKSH